MYKKILLSVAIALSISPPAHSQSTQFSKQEINSFVSKINRVTQQTIDSCKKNNLSILRGSGEDPYQSRQACIDFVGTIRPYLVELNFAAANYDMTKIIENFDYIHPIGIETNEIISKNLEYQTMYTKRETRRIRNGY